MVFVTLNIFNILEDTKMPEESKLKKLVTTKRGSNEAENWMFSLIPVAMAFTFYIIFIMYSDIDNKNLFLAYGATAGFIGLETYWVLRGWKKNHGSTVLMGLLGIVATLGALKFYLSFL